MANEITNLFEEFKEELNISQIDADSVLKAIDEKIRWYRMKINNPKYKDIVPIKTKALMKLKAYIQENPNDIEEFVNSSIDDSKGGKRKVYGISFGTTYSSIAYIDENGNANTILIDSSMEMPSYVAFEKWGSVLVGEAAKEMLGFESSKVCGYIKEQLGDYDFKFCVGKEEYSSEFITALILKKLVNEANKFMGDVTNDIVLTYPTYFGSETKNSLMSAAKIAGLNVVDAICEPIAIAISYIGHLVTNQVILIYDLGGATFDVTVIKINGKDIQVLAADGFRTLGGYSWDYEIISYVLNYGEQRGYTHEEMFDCDLIRKAETAKKKISRQDTAIIKIMGERIEITRETFEQLTSELLERTIMKVREVIGQIQSSIHVDKILIAGGSSLMPQVRTRIMQEFPNTNVEYFNSNLNIAKGAATFGLGMAK